MTLYSRRGAGSVICDICGSGSWRTSGARSSSSASLTWWCIWHSASSRTCAKIRQRRQHQGQAHEAPGQRARGRHQGGPAARPSTSLRVCCTAAPAPALAPVALPSTAHCPASGDHPPTSTRPPPTRTAIRAAAARRPTGLWGQGPPPSTWPAPTRTAIRAARRSSDTDYGARARAGGTCLVAVLHAASDNGCWRRAAGEASLQTAPDARCTPHTHRMMLAASRTSSTRH